MNPENDRRTRAKGDVPVVWYIDMVLFAVWILACFCVDGNGRVFALSETASTAVFVALLLCGLSASSFVIALDPRRRLAAAVFVAVYIVLALPALI